MLATEEFCRELKEAGIAYFAGVPDSLLKEFCACVTATVPSDQHVIAANEGAAVALAAGYHLATGRTGLVYLQNSGLGNLVNPLTSLADPEVYSIPMLLLIGWRGEPGVPDEPQHRKQGRVTPALLAALEVPHVVLPTEPSLAEAAIRTAVEWTQAHQAPYALLVRKGTFAPYAGAGTKAGAGGWQREACLRQILDYLVRDEILVTSTGMMSREVFEYRQARGEGHAREFLTVGCMGHASQIALGLAGQKPGREIWCLDGDGAALMHLGSLAINGCSQTRNFRHVVLNNGAHDSVGGQPTVGRQIDFPALARACGYRWTGRVADAQELGRALDALHGVEGPAFLEIVIRPGARADLGRPTTSPLDNKREFMTYVAG